MKNSLSWLVLLALFFSACNLSGVGGQTNGQPSAGQPAETQAPSVDTAIAQLVATELAKTIVPGSGQTLEATAGPPVESEMATAPVVTEAPTASQASMETLAAPEASPTPDLALEATAHALPTAGPAPTESPEASIPVSPAASPGAILPAPLLFISDQDESLQIWRLDADGTTLKQLTHEEAGVAEFDAARGDGRIAYVAGNDLIVISADGSGRKVLVDGPELPPENDPERALLEIGRPRWSPDGATIAYRLGGVNLIPASGGAPSLILKSDALPPPPDYKSTAPVYGYWPESWAPDGKRLLIGYSVFPETGGLGVLSVSGGQPLLIKPVESIACCNPVWSKDGASIYYANPFFGMITAGLWRADPASGASQTLVPGQANDGTYNLPGFVYQASDGKLFYLYGHTDKPPEGDVKLTPVSSAPDGLTGLAPLRADGWLAAEALWAPDGSGVVILDQSSASPQQNLILGKLVYLKSDNSPALPLPVVGSMLRWGR